MRRLEPGSVVHGLRIERELGRGAFGVVYLAEDELIGRRVAIKTVSASAATEVARDRALREARAVGRLNSPHIVTLHRVHPDEDGWLLEMEYVEGGSLSDLLKAGAPIPPERVLEIVRGILAGLAVAHGAGVVHGDVKPGNVLFDRSGAVKLVDFGLSWMIDDQSVSSGIDLGPAGTPAYMAPEVIMGERGDATSDLWSVGVLLYRMLAGRMPFKTASLQELFFSVQNSTPTPLPAGVTPLLAATVTRLLAKEAGERFPDAGVALASLEGTPATTTRPAARAADVEDRPAPALLGRDRELDRLDLLLDRQEQGTGAAVLVTGTGGIGKSALVQALAARASRRGCAVVEATLSAIEGALRPLLRAARHAVQAGAYAAGTVPGVEDVPPELVRELLDGNVEPASPQAGWATERLLAALAHERPLVLVVENAHEVTVEELMLVRGLAQRLPDEGVIVAITYRSFDVEASASQQALAGYSELARMEGIVHVGLEPLSSDAIHRFLERETHAAHIDADVAHRIIGLAEGNPLIALEMLRHLEREGSIVMEGSALHATGAWDGTSLPGRLHELVTSRLADLDEGQRAMLDAAAVDGREFDGEAIGAVLDRPLLDVLRELQRLYRRRGLIEPHGEQYRFTSGLIQEVIYDDIAPALRRAMHEALARHLEARESPVTPERVGLHWERAGQLDRAVPHLMRAASNAAGREEKTRVIDLCRRSGLLAPDAAAPVEYADALIRVAHALLESGRGDEGTALLARLRESARAAGDRTLEHRIVVSDAEMRHRLNGASAVDTEALGKALAALPTSAASANGRVLLGTIAKWRGEPAEAERWLRRAHEEFRELGLPGGHAKAIFSLGNVALVQSRYAEAMEHYSEAASILRRVGKRLSACACDVNRAKAALDAGEMGPELVGSVERAVRELALERSTLAVAASGILAQLRYSLGDPAGARRALDAAADMPAADAAANIQIVEMERAMLSAAAGDLADAYESIRVARSAAEAREYATGRIETQLAEAAFRCYGGDFDRAAELAREAGERLRDVEDLPRSEFAVWFAEAALFGLDPAALPAWPDRWLDAARAMIEPVAPIDVPELVSGVYRAARSPLRAWIASEAARRDGNPADAARIARDGLGEAEATGHVWLQLALQRHLWRLAGDPARRERFEALRERVAGKLDEIPDRERMLRAWEP